jgi:hypothetical protein
MAKTLPPWGKLAYGIGAGGFSLIDRIMVSFLMHYYLINPIKGETALVAPLASAIGYLRCSRCHRCRGFRLGRKTLRAAS